MVCGDLINRGGKAVVLGMINGFVRDELGHTLIATGAVVNNERSKNT
jgi:hypothetical protein